jgi:ribosomal protein S18 acetylase RimI-like enzyme
VGSFLLQELARRARGLGLQQVTLKVHLTNQRAVRFYEANGFQIVGEAAPNLLMGKNL